VEFTEEDKRKNLEYTKKVSQERGRRFTELTHGRKGLDLLSAQLKHELEVYYDQFTRPMPLQVVSQRYNKQIKKYVPTFQAFVTGLTNSGEFIIIDTVRRGRRFLMLTEQLNKLGIMAYSAEFDQYVGQLDEIR